MTLALRKRVVNFYEVRLHSMAKPGIQSPSCAPLPDLLQHFTALARAKGNPRPVTLKRTEEINTVLADWRFEPADNCYALLLNKANAALSDVALRDLKTTRLRMAGKTRVEGIEVSAHALLRPNADGHTAALLLTMGAGVSAGDVASMLRLLARLAAALPAARQLFYFDEPSGAKGANGHALQYKVRYGFETVGLMGQTLEEALRTGEFEGVDLIADEQQRFDEGGNLKVTARSLAVKATIPKAVTGPSLSNAVRAFRQTADGAMYNRMRLRYITKSGQNTSATLALNDLDAAFTRREQVQFASDVQAQQAALDPVILAGMKPLLQLV